MIFPNTIQDFAKALVTQIFTDLVFINKPHKIYNSKMAKRIAKMGTDDFYSGEYPIMKWIKENRTKYNIEAVHSGATRIAILFDENSSLHDVVIKIPMGKLNYCSRERKFYTYAKAEKVEQYFAPTEYIGSVTIPVITGRVQIPLYLMTRAENCQDALYDSAAEYLRGSDLESEFCVEYYVDDDEDINSVSEEELINRYLCNCESEQIVEYAFAETGIAGDLYNFCQRYNINDIHEDNVGLIKDKNGFSHYVIIDYAGYGT